MELVFIGALGGAALGFASGFMTGWWRKPCVAYFEAGEVGEESEELQEAHAAVAARTQRRFDRIVATARSAGKITNEGVEDLFCISDRTATRYLHLLVEEGRLERHGTGRNTYYTPKDW